MKECNVDFVHFDVIDGNFAPDFTMGSSIINKIRDSTSLPSDYHLMVEEPGRLFDSFEISTGDIFTIHQEGSRNLHRDLVRIRQKGGRVGVALNPATPVEALDYIIEDIDRIPRKVNKFFKYFNRKDLECQFIDIKHSINIKDNCLILIKVRERSLDAWCFHKLHVALQTATSNLVHQLLNQHQTYQNPQMACEQPTRQYSLC